MLIQTAIPTLLLLLLVVVIRRKQRMIRERVGDNKHLLILAMEQFQMESTAHLVSYRLE